MWKCQQWLPVSLGSENVDAFNCGVQQEEFVGSMQWEPSKQGLVRLLAGEH